MISEESIVEILQYFELFSLQEWVIFIFKDLILTVIITAGMLKAYDWLKNRRRANDIVKFLRKDNAPTRNSLRGKHLADRLLDIYNGKLTPLVSRDEIYKRGNYWESCWNENAIDNMLQAKGLVDIFEEQGLRKVRLLEDRITKAVIKSLIKLESHNQI